MKFAVATLFAMMSTLLRNTCLLPKRKPFSFSATVYRMDSCSSAAKLIRLCSQKKLRAAGLNFQLINASASGGTTDGGLERLPAHLKQRIDIFILELGINDAFRGLPTDQIEKNLRQIIDRVKARNPNVCVIIAGMQLPSYTADDYVSAFGNMFADLATKNGAGLVPYLLQGVAGNPSLNLPDGIHPNAAGHKVLAENVWRVLEPVAREVGSARL